MNTVVVVVAVAFAILFLLLFTHERDLRDAEAKVVRNFLIESLAEGSWKTVGAPPQCVEGCRSYSWANIKHKSGLTVLFIYKGQMPLYFKVWLNPKTGRKEILPYQE